MQQLEINRRITDSFVQSLWNFMCLIKTYLNVWKIIMFSRKTKILMLSALSLFHRCGHPHIHLKMLSFCFMLLFSTSQSQLCSTRGAAFLNKPLRIDAWKRKNTPVTRIPKSFIFWHSIVNWKQVQDALIMQENGLKGRLLP